jgi:hypothetical protein
MAFPFMNRRVDWNWPSFVFVVLLFAGLYIAIKTWPGETTEQFEQRRQQEYRALGESEKKCQAELNMTVGEDFDDCVGYRMRVYHRQQKRLSEGYKEVEHHSK